MPLQLPGSRARRISRQAAEWRIEMLEPASSDVRAKFDAWLAADPEHRRAYDELEGFIALSPRSSHRPDRTSSVGPAPLRPAWAVAAAVAIIIGALLLFGGRAPDPAFAAVVNAGPFIRTVRLADGSIVTLDVGTRLEVALAPGARTVRLREGRARFIVAGDAAHPFLVTSPAGQIACGSGRFDVSLGETGMAVFPLDGAISVSPAGEEKLGRATLMRTPVQVSEGAMVPLERPNRDRLWPASRLWFEGVRLDLIVAKANELGSPPIRAGDAGLGRLEVTAVLDLRDTRSLARKLAAALDLRVSETSNEILLTR